MPKPVIFLISTGLGRIHRGFERHISGLGQALMDEQQLPWQVMILGGKREGRQNWHSVANLSRNTPLLLKMGFKWHTRYRVEQASFLLGLLPALLTYKPAIIYLAEYHLYCWLYKVRNLLGLKFSLVMYTGGTGIPGLFDAHCDFVHHVTDDLVAKALQMGIPPNRQAVIPHFIETSFAYQDTVITALRQKAGHKKILLCVAAHNTNHKRIDLFAKRLKPFAASVFPVVVGDATEETDALHQLFQKYFEGEYLLTTAAAGEMGNYYAAADAFVSASAYESFGLAYIEAAWHGLPILCHRHKIIEQLLGNHAVLADFEHETNFTDEAEIFLKSLPPYHAAHKPLHDYVNRKFSWGSLQPAYLNMFEGLFKKQY